MDNKVRETRKDIGMSVAELARRSGVSRTTIHLVEKGDDNLRADKMVAIANALRVDPRDIFFIESGNQDLQKTL